MMFWLDRHRRLRDQISAYIDGALDNAAAARLETHLAECTRCRAELEQLRATAAALRELPEAQAPRSFALAPEQAPIPRPAVPAPPLAFGVRMAAAAVAVALAAVLLVDLGDLGGGGAPEEAAPPAMIGERQAEEARLLAEGTPTPEPYGTPAAAQTGAEGGVGGAAEDAGAEFRGEATVTPSPSPLPDVTAMPRGAEGTLVPQGLTPSPGAGVEEAMPTSAAGGGIDALTAAEIGLAAAFGILVAGNLALAFARRKR